MREKLVEHWLIRASERGYQIPLCTALAAKGYTVIHSSRHCAMEMGKDILARNKDGEIVCFQLKAMKGKKMTLSEWRSDLQQQVFPLVMGKVVHPGITEKIHKSIIVVSGYINEEVSHEIEQFNASQEDSGHKGKTVAVWTLGDLTKIFSDHLSAIGPDEPELLINGLSYS